jgi:hypothetical protein
VEEAIVGDLLEEYQHRRSPVWYWRQVIVAIAVGALRDLRSHKGAAVCAIVVGVSIVNIPFVVLISSPAARLSGLPVPVSVQIIAAQMLMIGAAILAGWVVGRLFIAHRAAAVLSLAAAILVDGFVVLPDVVDLAPTVLASIVVLYGFTAIVGGTLGRTRTPAVR